MRLTTPWPRSILAPWTGNADGSSYTHNERYAGVWSWGKRKWTRSPETSARTPKTKGDTEVIRAERPELRIIDPKVWQAVQERLAGVHAAFTRNKDGTAKGRAVPGKVTRYLLSGVLVCGECGAPLIITGTDPTTRTYRCGDHLKRGTCPSRIAMREAVARRSVLKTMLEALGTPAAIAHLRTRVTERLKQIASEQEAERRSRHRRLDDLEGKIANLVGFLAAGNTSPSVASKLRELEAEAERERNAVAVLDDAERLASAMPSHAEVMARVMDLEELLEGDPNAGREALRAHLAGGHLVVQQVSARDYLVRGDLVPVEYLTRSARSKRVSSDGSGGAVGVGETSEGSVIVMGPLEQSVRAAA
jgi:hypothetical protein